MNLFPAFALADGAPTLPIPLKPRTDEEEKEPKYRNQAAVSELASIEFINHIRIC